MHLYFQSFPNFVKTLKIRVKLILNCPQVHAITHTFTTDVRIKKLSSYLFNVFFACGNFTATISIISDDVTFLLSLKN